MSGDTPPIDPNAPTAHYNQKPRRNAEFLTPPNIIKAKVGSGGLSDDILIKAQAVLETNNTDFAPLAEMYLQNLNAAIDGGKFLIGFMGDHETAILSMIYPSMQLKANGGMFHFPIITQLADKMVQFLEVIETIDRDVIDLVNAFVITIRAVIAGRVHDIKSARGQELLSALDGACRRYFTRHPENRNPV